MKINIKLDILAQNLGKTITQISEETGLNRNTVTALYHNKVDGIKFDTIEKICSTYQISLADIIEISQPEPVKSIPPESITVTDPYKQEGEIVLFTALPPFFYAHTLPKEYFPSIVKFGGFIMYFLKDYGHIYWPREAMNNTAKESYQRYGTKEKLDRLFFEFKPHAVALEKLYKYQSEKEIISLSDQDLIVFSQKLWKAYEGFWHLSLFIDFFDAGYDVKTIADIQKRYGFTDAEVVVLTTSQQMTFGNERLLRLTEIVKKIARRKLLKKAEIKLYIQSLPEINEYIKDYDYFKSNYAHINHLTIDEVTDEIIDLLKDSRWAVEYEKLSTYTIKVKKNVIAILKKHNLKDNPFYFFQMLTYWREYRKQINLMGIHLMHYILFSIEQKTGIPYKYLKHLTFDEIPNILKGLITRDQMQKRYEEGVVLSTIGGHSKLIEGKEANSIFDEMEKRIKGQSMEKILAGRVACQGYAKGIARIVLGQEDFPKFKEGEILVTGMTRPEFVPLMKKAAAIVTNEGGITCHAAIVSRELGKPCIIGTQKATHVIKDGDLIEVRANHGTVRILS